VEIGWTWLAASVQGTGIDTEAKLLLMDHAFENLRVARVDFKTAAEWPEIQAGLRARLEPLAPS
jgi:RimJ/RimL family protein N-acetyltransferase